MLTLNSYQPFLLPFERMVTATIPAIELRETEDSVIVTAHLPGVDPQDIEVRANGHSLTFLGQQHRHLRNHYRYTVSYEQFQHTIPLPVAVRDSQVQVTFGADDVRVTLPKARATGSVGAAPLKTLSQTGQQLARRWRQTKSWLGHRLQGWGRRLLDS